MDENIRIESHINSIEKLFNYLNKDIEVFKNLYGIPINVAILESIENDDNLRRLIASITSDFSKAQAILGEKLFKEILYFTDEINDKNISFFEILSILEKLSIIKNRIEWKQVKEIRNNIAHEYPEEVDKLCENLNMIFKKVVFLKNSFENIKIFYLKYKDDLQRMV